MNWKYYLRLSSTAICLVLELNLSAQRYVNPVDKKNAGFTLFSFSQAPECFTSEKLNSLIPEKNNYKPIKISDQDFQTLSAYDHFIHSFYYPEWYYQSCSLFGEPSNILQTIPAFLKRQGEGLIMSTRQENALVENRDSTIILMIRCIEQTGKVQDEFKRTMIDLHAFELIPTLINTIRNKQEVKDPYILTTLCLLMRFDFDPFQNSSIYKNLYPLDRNGYYISEEGYKRTIPFKEKNFDLITNLALEYFQFRKDSPNEFIHMERGEYSIGKKGHTINPERKVEVGSFYISRYEITNKQFKHFVETTSYITIAEKNKDAFVFRVGLDEFEWEQDSTANWRFPNGILQGGIESKMNHPVTCISYHDALAYCKWANVRLPTIEEWEIASRAGNNVTDYYFSENAADIHKHANIWRGKTHLMEYEDEDYITTSPVGSFKPNSLGLYDIYGNVFEFCLNTPRAFDAFEGVAAARGGSWWCSIYACGFFNSVDIGRVKKEASFSNNGFRVVL